MKRLPIAAAKMVASRYNQDQVILITFDKKDGLTHVVSYGRSLLDCSQAAQGANRIKQTLRFPADLCETEPARIKRMKARITELERQIAALK